MELKRKKSTNKRTKKKTPPISKPTKLHDLNHVSEIV
jgi:hypothetical protein